MKRLTWSILGIFFLGCNSHSKMNSDFIKKYGNNNFDEFKNTSMFVRSGDRDGGLIVFAYDNNIPPELNNGAYLVTIDYKRGKIKNTSCHLMKDSSLADRHRLEKLALIFMGYSIAYLGVDSVDNVSISLKMNTRPDLIRFSGLRYKTDKYKDWKPVKDNWYENEDE